MFVVFLILLVIAVVVTALAFVDDIETGLAALFICLIILTLPFLMTFRLKISDDTYTGYIYSRDSSWGYTTYHIRYSQGAGEDTQPSFTVKAGSDVEKQLDELVGSDSKVQIKVPSAAPKFVNNIFEPSSFAELKKIEEK